MIADSNSNIAWHRVQLKKNRDAVKAFETARFTIGEMAGSKTRILEMRCVAKCLRSRRSREEPCGLAPQADWSV